MELYDERLEQLGKKKADKLFIKDTLLLFRKDIIRPAEGSTKLNYYGMFKNYLKTSIRNLINQKGYTAINIFSLTISMALSMLIILFIIDQDQQDEYNPNASNIYRTSTLFQEEDSERLLGTSPYELQELIELNNEYVEESAQIIKTSGTLRLGEDDISFAGLYASNNILSFFHLDLVEGNQQTALENGVIVSKTLADKLLGEISPIGTLITVDNLGDFIIAGVVDESNYQTHLSFDLILPIQSFVQKPQNKVLLSDWEEGSKVFYNYFRLQPNTSAYLQSSLATLEGRFPEEKRNQFTFKLQRLDEINLGSVIPNEIGTTTPAFVGYFFAVLSLVLILSASFNYMNMAIARGLKRGREVGIRKVLGADRKKVIAQFLVEAQLVIFISLVAAFVLLQLLVPIFNNLKILRDIDGAITMNFNGNLSVYISFIAFALIVGFVSGIYPALYLSSFKSISVLKGSSGSKKSPLSLFRKVLVFFQYAFSIIFIITAIVLYQQAKIFDKTDYGFQHANIINVPMRRSVPYEVFRTELLKNPQIAGVSAVSQLPVISAFEEVELTSRSDQESITKSSVFSIDPYTIDNLGLELLTGRNFSSTDLNETDNVLINEKAMQSLGFANPEDAIAKVIDLKSVDKETRQDITQKKKIIGVVKDFNYRFVFMESGPLMMTYEPSTLNTINIKLAGVSPKAGVKIIESVWEDFDSIHPLNYEIYKYHMDDINSEFGELVNIIGLVSMIAILIASLGQFSMVVHHVQLKTKEIGIRKALGSELSGLMLGLSRGFLWVIALAIIVATPLAVLLNIAWTNKLYNAPDISFFNVGIGVGVVLIMSLGTIYLLVSRAVQANPVDSLKYE